MNTLGIEATPEEVDLMVDEIDQDNSGEIDFEGTYTTCVCAALQFLKTYRSRSALMG